MTEVLQFASVSSMSDILHCICTLAHTKSYRISHKHAASGMYYTHTRAHIYIHNVMHIHTVELCTEHYSSFPLSLAQWGAELVQHLVAILWQERDCFGMEDYFGSSLDEVANVSVHTLMYVYDVIYIICACNQAIRISFYIRTTGSGSKQYIYTMYTVHIGSACNV